MKRVAVLLGVLGAAAVLGPIALADTKPPTPTLQEDLTHLRGSWSTSKKAPMSWKVTFRPGKDKGKMTGQATWKVSGTIKKKMGTKELVSTFVRNVSGTFELKQEGKKRVIVRAKKTGKSDLPQKIFYRIDGATLVLIVPKGKLEGEYILKRTKDDRKTKKDEKKPKKDKKKPG